MKSRRRSRRSSAVVRRLKAASVAASSHRRRVGRKTMAGSKLYELSAVNNVAGGISGMRSFITVCQKPERERATVRILHHQATKSQSVLVLCFVSLCLGG